MNPAFIVPDTWQNILAPALSSVEAHRLASFLATEELAGKRIFPPANLRFQALELVKPEAAKVVILGQDPYHGEGQAHGLAFSVPDGVRQPPSLGNIFKELSRDFGSPAPKSGTLETWTSQGVLLMNTVLSVEEAKAGSHQGKGWEAITDAVIAHVGQRASPCVFMLWGSHAQKKRALVDGTRHLVLEAPHPSPLSAHRGFIGCGHFSSTNAWLEAMGRQPIGW